MTIASKKIIAREFLFLMSCIFLTIVAYVVTISYSNIQSRRTVRLSTNIENKNSLATQLAKSYNDSIKSLEYIKGVYLNLINIHPPLPQGFKPLNKADIDYESYIQNRDSFALMLKSDKAFRLRIYNELKKEYGENEMPEFDLFETKIGTTNKVHYPATITNDYNQSLTLRQEIKSLLKEQDDLLTKSNIDSKNITKWTFLISIITLFLLRYLLYATKWSLKTIRQK